MTRKNLVYVVGPRYADRRIVLGVLDEIQEKFGLGGVVHHGRNGLDADAAAWADQSGLPCFCVGRDMSVPRQYAAVFEYLRPEWSVLFPGATAPAYLEELVREQGGSLYVVDPSS